MADLIIPASVGGPARTPQKTRGIVKPAVEVGPERKEAAPLVVPISVGGSFEAPDVQPPEAGAKTPSLFERGLDLFTGELRETAEAKGLPELAAASGISSGELVKDLKTAAGLMFAADDNAKIDIVRQNFPDAKITQDAEGTTIFEFPDGKKAVLNKPGLSFQDVVGFLGDTAAFYGPTKLAGLGRGLLQKFAIGGAASAATQAGLEKGAQALGSQQEVDPVSVGLAGALGGASELVGPAVKRITTGRKASRLGVDPGDVGPPGGGDGGGIIGPPGDAPLPTGRPEDFAETLQEVAEAERITRKTGVPFFRAQKTGDLTDLERQSYVATLPGASRKAAQELKGQNKQSYDAVIDTLNTIAPEEAVEAAEGGIRSAAQLAIEAQKTIRKEAASPFYKEAFKNQTRYKATQTQSLIEGKLGDTSPGSDLDKNLRKIKRFFEPRVKGGVVQEGRTIKQLHEAKRAVDGLIVKAKTSGDGTLARDLMGVKTELLKEVDVFSPNYKQARAAFAAESPAIERLQDSLIGVTSKLKDVQLERVRGALFDPKNTPGAMVKARKLIEAQDPEAWASIVRAEIEDRIGKVRVDLAEVGATTQNVPGQLHRAIFGAEKQKRVLYAALDPESAKNFRYLEKGLERAARGRPGGSQTATRLKFDKEIKSGISGVIRALFSGPATAVGKGITTAAGVGEDVIFNRNARALADVMFNPKWKPDIKELRAINPNSPEAGRVLRGIVERAKKDLPKPATQAAAPDIGE